MIIFLILFAFLLFLFLRKFKAPLPASLNMVNGGLKKGKTLSSLYLAIRAYKKACFPFKVRLKFAKLLGASKDKIRELEAQMPLFYSNIALVNLPFPVYELELSTLKFETRLKERSILFIDEVSLLASAHERTLAQISDLISQYFLLFSHCTKGGKCFMNTQALAQVNASVRKPLTDILYIIGSRKWAFLPFISVYYRLERFEFDRDIIDVQGDIRDKSYKFIVPSWIYKKYDCFAYYGLVEDLPISEKLLCDVKNKNGVTKNVTSFTTVRKELEEQEKKTSKISFKDYLKNK